jgi:hypothetical protein
MTERMTSADFRSMASAPAKSKYRAKRTVVDGISFHSEIEATRYATLKLMVRCGDISHLVLQPKFELHVNGQLVCSYIADFAYFEGENRVVEDVKGMVLPEYKLKRSLMKAVYGIEIREIFSSKTRKPQRRLTKRRKN